MAKKTNQETTNEEIGTVEEIKKDESNNIIEELKNEIETKNSLSPRTFRFQRLIGFGKFLVDMFRYQCAGKCI